MKIRHLSIVAGLVVRHGDLSHEMTLSMSQSIKINPFLTDSLRQIKETFGQFLTGLPRFLFIDVSFRE